MLTGIASKAGLGRLIYTAFHAPLGMIRRSMSEGGPIEQWRNEKGRRAMVESAAKLPVLTDPGNPLPIAANFLSGEKFWYQTLFCLVSLQLHLDRRIDAVVFDDGTFTRATMDRIRQVVPWVRFHEARAIHASLDAHLPADRFPALRALRLTYPHLRKLTDIHCAAQDWTLVFDSDMLFFRRPQALVDWMQAPATPLYMCDTQTAYGYSQGLLEELAGGPVPERVNVGLYSYRGDAIDWDRIEYWCAEMLRREGPHYLQEQAMVAMMLVGTDARVLPREDYIVMPSRAEGADPQGVLHHYVSVSKRSYFRDTWPMVMAEAIRASGAQTA